MHDINALQQYILERSVADDFASAAKEWKLIRITWADEGAHCICGMPIKEICQIRNTLTCKIAYVGNGCIKRFGIDLGRVFDGFRAIRDNNCARPNRDLIAYAKRMGYLSADEQGFLENVRRKRDLTDRQLRWLEDINRRILRRAGVSEEIQRHRASARHVISREDLLSRSQSFWAFFLEPRI